ncbi:hypothetical protein SAMN05660649_02489 [Desulfotomaculum arcticum]|uniref:Uncharacterized protein n=2 Tax=Desulfotruncus TaxID=2867377 RepID=A0A1I2U837_9FIRM|nr:hypothetical protein SAMN05660649_02489 [Desulfotomaculum arcticum] [Desulfotruncus arcticus DSM 17038]
MKVGLEMLKPHLAAGDSKSSGTVVIRLKDAVVSGINCLIIEAVEAYTEGDNRIIESIQLVEVFGEDNNGALRQYVQLHKAHPEKEYYVVHTSRPALNVKERHWTE